MNLPLFQSPSLRGSGRFIIPVIPIILLFILFQSPSLRGSGRFRYWVYPICRSSFYVSIPFIAGQWSLQAEVAPPPPRNPPFQSPSLRGSGRFDATSDEEIASQLRFNPLHCGAVVAS